MLCQYGQLLDYAINKNLVASKRKKVLCEMVHLHCPWIYQYSFLSAVQDKDINYFYIGSGRK